MQEVFFSISKLYIPFKESFEFSRFNKKVKLATIKSIQEVFSFPQFKENANFN